MKPERFRLILAATVLACVLMAVPALAAGPYTIRGTVFNPDGTPAAGANIALIPHTGSALDPENLYWKIPGYSFHRTTTDANGNFVLTNVIDHPENKIHRYALAYDGPSVFIHGNVHVVLGRPDSEFTMNLITAEATAVKLYLTDASGLPFTGTKPVYVESGTLLTPPNPIVGISYVRDITFTNGEAVIERVVIKDAVNHTGRIAIIQETSAQALKNYLQRQGLRYADTRNALKRVAKSVKGISLDEAVQFVPGGFTVVTMSYL